MKKTSHPTEDCNCSSCVWKRAMVKVGKKGHKRKGDFNRSLEVQAQRRALGLNHFQSSVRIKRKPYNECRTGLVSTHRGIKFAKLFMLKEDHTVLNKLSTEPNTIPGLANTTFKECIPDYCVPGCTIDRHINRVTKTMYRLLDRKLVMRRKVNMTSVKHTVHSKDPVIYDKAVWMYSLHDQGVVNKLLYRFRRWKLSIRTTWCNHCELVMITRNRKKFKGIQGRGGQKPYFVPMPIKYVIGLMRRL